MKNAATILTPVAPETRIQSLDVLRGFAILGILIMNIQLYSMIAAAYLNPAAYGDFTGLNRIVWMFSHLFADQKFMTLFSLLFGAGIILFCSKAAQKGQKPAALHYRRNFWLLVIGLVHAYIFWHGDILVPYALCAFVVFLFRNKKPNTLMILGILSLLVPLALYLLFGFSMRFWPEEAVAGIMQSWQPEAEMIQKELAAYTGGFAEQMTHRAPASLAFQTFIFIIWAGWRAGGLMLIGMALYKWGVITGKKPARFYRNWTIAGFTIGVPLIVLGIHQNFANNWALHYSMFIGSQFNYVGSLFVAMAYLSIIMLWMQSANKTGIKKRLAAAGRMAFSNYLGQTLICTFIFYGHGFGLFGKVERWQQLLVFICIGAIQLIISPLWLNYFRFGPAEWLWRSLTYWKIQPWRM